jgi:hypothetical protein
MNIIRLFEHRHKKTDAYIGEFDITANRAEIFGDNNFFIEGTDLTIVNKDVFKTMFGEIEDLNADFEVFSKTLKKYCGIVVTIYNEDIVFIDMEKILSFSEKTDTPGVKTVVLNF